MCWIAVQNTKEPLPEDVIRLAHRENPHGTGIVWAEKGCLRYWKLEGSADEVIECYLSALNSQKRIGPLAMHFRYGTHGTKGKDNIHPHFACGGEVAVLHNGILKVPDHSTFSDTSVWVKTVLHKRDRKQVMEPGFARHHEQFIGYNKIVFLDNRGNCEFLNARLGERVGKDWFSAWPLIGRRDISGFRPDRSTIVPYNTGCGSWWDHEDMKNERENVQRRLDQVELWSKIAKDQVSNETDTE